MSTYEELTEVSYDEVSWEVNQEFFHADRPFDRGRGHQEREKQKE